MVIGFIADCDITQKEEKKTSCKVDVICDRNVSMATVKMYHNFYLLLPFYPVFPFQQHLPPKPKCILRCEDSFQSFVDTLFMNDDVHLLFVQFKFKFDPMQLRRHVSFFTFLIYWHSQTPDLNPNKATLVENKVGQSYCILKPTLLKQGDL